MPVLSMKTGANETFSIISKISDDRFKGTNYF